MGRELLLFLMFFVSFWACQEKSFDSEQELYEWLFSEGSGYNQLAESESLLFKLIHLPSSLELADSLLDSDSTRNLVFQLRINPKGAEDLLKIRLNSQKEYEERVALLEFGMKEMFEATSDQKYSPSFLHYENYRGVKNEILIHVHFETELHLKNDFVVSFKDDVFHSGTHQFRFVKEKINHPPKLKIHKS